MIKSIKLWVLGGAIAALALILLQFDILLLLTPFLVIASGITAYYALKAERKEAMNGIPDEADKRQVEA